MNEYQDQVTWWEVQERQGFRRWKTISDHDTREQAEQACLPGQSIIRRHGLPAEDQS